MADKTKIMLSEQEQQIVNDTNWILTKQAIIQKVYHLFNEQVPVITKLFSTINIHSAGELLTAVPKISKGENYNGLPYAILDYPSLFNKENIFALRTMFWWGNFFSVTLHLSGRYKTQLANLIADRAINFPENFFICVHINPWQHHFEASNYVAMHELESGKLKDLIFKKDFIKIAVKYDLSQWKIIDSLLEAAYKNIIHLIKN